MQVRSCGIMERVTFQVSRISFVQYTPQGSSIWATMSTAAYFSYGVMACHKVVRYRYPSIVLVSESILKVSPDCGNVSIFFTQYLNSMVWVGSILHAWYEFTHIHGHIFVLITATSPACRSSHWSTIPRVMCLACRRSKKASCWSLLSLLTTSLSYPWLMEEDSPDSSKLRKFCEY